MKKKWVSVLLVFFALLSYMYVFKVLTGNYVYQNHDMYFHINRIKSLTNIWQSPMNFKTFFGMGSAVNLFYGWLTIYPINLLYNVTNNFSFSYNIFLYFLTFFTLCISYLCMFKIKANNFMSLLFSLAYTFSMYRAVCIWYRGALGEFVALTFYPLIFLAAYKLIVENKNYYALLAISFSLLLYTHVISSVIIFLFLLLAYVIAMFSTINYKWSLTLNFIKAGIVALLLSLAYIVPMLEQNFYQSINPPNIVVLSEQALPFKNMIIGSLKNDMTSFSIGTLPLFFSILTVIFIKRLSKTDLVIFLFGLFSLLITTTIFPWDILQQTPIRVIQVPWRFMGISTLFLCYSGSVTIYNLLSSKYKFSFFLVFLTSILGFNFLYLDKYDNNPEHLKIENTTIDTLTTYSYDYLPKDHALFAEQLTNRQVLSNGISIPYQKNTDDTDSTFIFEATAGEKIQIPIFVYKGIEVTNNGESISPLKKKESLVLVNSKEGSNEVTVRFKYTFLAKLSFSISVITLILLIVTWFKRPFLFHFLTKLK